MKYVILLICLCIGFTVRAAEIIPDKHEYIKAVVTDVQFKENRTLIGTTTRDVFTVTVELSDGSTQILENDHYDVHPGSKVYVHKRIDLDGYTTYTLDEPIRLPMMSLLVFIFIALSIWIGGKQGVKGLLTLFGSMFLLFLFLIPSIIKGYSPVLVSLSVATCIIVLGSYITHGFNRTTSTAVLGMICTVLGAGAVTYISMYAMGLTGLYSEDVVYLLFNTGGTLDVQGLLFAGIMIGLLGILYDVAIGQSIAIEELIRADHHMQSKKLIERGMRIGREHIGALVDTLALAYVGASLPLLLLFATSDSPILYILNREDISTELVRILVGSMSIIVAVPITTYIAVYILKKYGIPDHKTEGGCGHIHVDTEDCSTHNRHEKKTRVLK
ncbi:MAG: YibE/F family protein [Patescibacteria group bacterium]